MSFPLIKMLVTFDVENKHGIAASAAKQCEPFARRLAELPLARLAPKDEEQARESLMLIIDEETRRLQEMLLTLRSIVDADLAEAPARLAFETGPEGDRYRRYELANERLALQSFDRFLRTRNFVVNGRFDLIDVDLQTRVGSDLARSESVPEQSSCDEESIPRNEANLSVVSGPLSADGCNAETIDEPGAPGATTNEKNNQNPESRAPSHNQEASCDDIQVLRNEANTVRKEQREGAATAAVVGVKHLPHGGHPEHRGQHHARPSKRQVVPRDSLSRCPIPDAAA